MAEIMLTAEDIEKAESYIPIEKKKAMAELMTTFCVEEYADPNDGRVVKLPPQYRENRMSRQMFLMGVLAEMYLKKEYRYQKIHYMAGDEVVEKEVPLFMDADDYNDWAGSHVLNQLERMKKRRDALADKVYDLMGDFKLFENMLLGAIRDEVSARNDPASRLSAVLAMNGSEAAVAEAKANARAELAARESAGGEKP